MTVAARRAGSYTGPRQPVALRAERDGAHAHRIVPGMDRVAQDLRRIVAAVDAAADEDDGVIGPGVGGLAEDLGEDDHLDAALQVFQGGDQHRGSGAGDDPSRALDDPAQGDPGLVALVGEVSGIGGHVLGKLIGDISERVLREVEAKQLLLPALHHFFPPEHSILPTGTPPHLLPNTRKDHRSRMRREKPDTFGPNQLHEEIRIRIPVQGCIRRRNA